MADEYKKIAGTEEAAGSTGTYQKYEDTGDGHAMVVSLADNEIELAASTEVDVTDRAARLAGVVTVSPAATIVHGKTVVAAAGTEVALGASTVLTYGVRIKALAANTNNVYVGANPVTSLTGFVLDAGEEVFVEVANLATVFIDVDTNGEGVTYIGG